MAVAASVEDRTPTPTTPSPQKITELPVELQKKIFEHSTTNDLICLALVSKHFHAIASAQLYRIFSIVFPDDDDPFESPIDALASGLDALVTSQHEHAKYLKEIRMDTFSGGERGERAYRSFSYEVSCGKFMNTLLLLTLRKARALETFHWNIRVELNRAVLKELQSITGLQELHVRLQAGPSLFQPPPALPLSAPLLDVSTPSVPSFLSALATSDSTNSSTAAAVKQDASSTFSSAPNHVPVSQNPIFSGFHHLKHLAVLDIDALDYIPEIASSIRNCSSTLTELTLSFSEALAMKARKPAIEDSDDSDLENDEFSNPLAPPPPTTSNGGSHETPQDKEAKRKIAKRTQEGVLEKLLGVERQSTTIPKKDVKDAPAQTEDGRQRLRALELRLYNSSVENLLIAVTTLLANSEKVLGMDKNKGPLVWAMLRELGQSMLKSSRGISVPSAGDVAGKASAVSEVGKTVATQPDKEVGDKDVSTKIGSSTMANGSVEPGSDIATEEPTLGDTGSQEAKSAPSRAGNIMPDDIDLDHPDILDDDDEGEIADRQEFIVDFVNVIETAMQASEANARLAVNPLAEKDKEGQADDGSSVDVVSDLPAATVEPSVIEETANQPTSLTTPSAEISPVAEAEAEVSTSATDLVKEYIRSTRKLVLRSFSLYLIPMRASTVYRAIDIYSLHHITLLNVGPQEAFWSQLLAMQKSSPLNLRSIYTDNVTMAFLLLVSTLKSLDEIFLLERSSKYKVVSLAEATSVGMDCIRRLVLKKHIRTLKRLMIKNENDYSWDVDERTMSLMTKKGSNLTELAVSLGLRSFHLLLQYLPGLEKLRALHILHFRTDDTCTWVIRELRKFAMDNVAHHPQMKLEYIALDGTVEGLVRKPAGSEVKKADQTSTSIGKDKASSTDPVDSSDDSEEETSPSLKIETVENLNFYDVTDVKIFRKDIRAGRV